MTAFRMPRMVFHMKTTLNIDDGIMKRLREEAARQGKTMSEMVEASLRRSLERPRKAVEVKPLPSFNGNGTLVDVADRESLYQAMEGR